MLAKYPLKQEAEQVLELELAEGLYLLRIITSDDKVMDQKISSHHNN